ncbi:DUF859 family phage minor structural protein [Agromyces sp. NPDC127015]|uniref:DUF859 family phage minor structural protein n=1 Tax=Agromyces sp. NPDC127015 TaxID=3347108 RepID=UPI0036482387
MASWDAAMWDGYVLRLTVTQSSQSVANNTSVVAYSLQIIRPSGQADWSSDPSSWATNIGGSANSGSKSYDFGSYSVLTLTSGTKTITHNADGTKSISVSGSFSDAGGQIGSASIPAKTFTLTTIPRASNPTMSASAVDAGDPITVETHRASSSFTHTITYKIGSLTGTIATKTTAADVAWTPPLSLCAAIPAATSGTCTITVETFSGSTSLGKDTTSFTLRVPSSVVPDFSTISHSEAVASVAAQVGAYVKGLTKLTLTIGGEAGAYGSTITARKITVAGQTINADSGTTPSPINQSGTVTVTGTVTDSRGRTRTKTISVTVLNWAAPTVSQATMRRAAVGGTPQNDGTTIRVDLGCAVTSLNNGGEKNSLTYRLYVRERGTTTWTLAAGPTTPAGVSYSGMLLASSYAIEDSWEVRVDVSDKFATTTVQGTVATAAIDVHFDAGVGVGIGKFREEGMLDVAGSVRIGATGDASLSSTAHGLQVGPTSGLNLIVDQNEIMARNNGAAAGLNLQLDGGQVVIGSETAQGTLRIPGTGDVSLTSTAHGLQLGPNSGVNVAIDNNELQGRNNGAASAFGINGSGGDINLGSSSSEVNIPGHVDAPGQQYNSAAGSVAVPSGGSNIAPFYYSTAIAVTFPTSRFSTPPLVNVSYVGVGVGFANAVGDVSSGALGTQTTGMTVVAARLNAAFGTGGNGVRVHWVAWQHTASNAHG